MGRRPAPRTQVVPAHPEPYIRQPIKKRGRPKRSGPKKKDRYDAVRASPSKRPGQRWITVSLPEDAYYMLKEMAAFYKVGMGAYMQSLLVPAFDKAYQESLTLQRIAKTREKAKNETQDRNDIPRRTHF
jgi:hypothetical protein